MRRCGIKGLYHGMSPALVAGFSKCALRFTVFDYYRSSWSISGERKQRSPGNGPRIIAIGVLTGIVESACIIAPTETLKTRMIQQQSLRNSDIILNARHILSAIVRQDGFRGVYRGILPVMIKQALTQSIHIGAYSALRHLRAPESLMEDTLSGWDVATMGAFAGGISVTLTQPVDVVKTRLQQFWHHEGKRGMTRVTKEIWLKEGCTGFWRGMTPRLVRQMEVSFFGYMSMLRHSCIVVDGGHDACILYPLFQCFANVLFALIFRAATMTFIDSPPHVHWQLDNEHDLGSAWLLGDGPSSCDVIGNDVQLRPSFHF